MMRPTGGRHRPVLALVLTTALLAVGSCAADSDTDGNGTSDPTTSIDAADGDGADPDGADGVPGVADDCAPADDARVEVTPSWPGPRLRATTGGPPLQIDLTEVITADCIVLADTYSAALDIATPALGSVTHEAGFVVTFESAPPPPDPDAPDAPWWGEDRVRACVPIDDGRLSCSNIDIDVVRSDVAELAEGFDTDTLPKMLSPLSRAEPSDGGAAPADVARLQDALAAEWALGLVAAALESPQTPPALVDACDDTATDLDTLRERGRQLIDRHSALSDLGGLELGVAMGTEPDPTLSAQANVVLAEAGDWVDCRL
ncbi:MAG: hypothetical protein U5K29_12640 [Acidimicrobiales bacterium]|nr:hypothetical protein [Acidimicrobiales bacterium]